MAAPGVRMLRGCPRTRTRPVACGSSPNSACAISDRPAPTRPANPSTSPARSVNETPPKPAGLDRSSTRSTLVAGRGADVRREVLAERPADHQLHQRRRGPAPPSGASPT